MSLPLQVVSRCDITLLQEVMDDGAVKKLLTSLNRYRYSHNNNLQCCSLLYPSCTQGLLESLPAVLLWNDVVQSFWASAGIVVPEVMGDGIMFTCKEHKLTLVTIC